MYSIIFIYMSISDRCRAYHLLLNCAIVDCSTIGLGSLNTAVLHRSKEERGESDEEHLLLVLARWPIALWASLSHTHFNNHSTRIFQSCDGHTSRWQHDSCSCWDYYPLAPSANMSVIVNQLSLPFNPLFNPPYILLYYIFNQRYSCFFCGIYVIHIFQCCGCSLQQVIIIKTHSYAYHICLLSLKYKAALWKAQLQSTSMW